MQNTQTGRISGRVSILSITKCDQIAPVFHQYPCSFSWAARYNDFETAKAVNEAVGERKITHVQYHGPAPYVQHVHLDVVPK